MQTKLYLFSVQSFLVLSSYFLPSTSLLLMVMLLSQKGKIPKGQVPGLHRYDMPLERSLTHNASLSFHELTGSWDS